MHSNNDTYPLCYAMKGSDSLRYQSSSGGAFSIIAEYILEKGGYICGASFSDDFLHVNHILSRSTEDLRKLRTSKYLQSNIDPQIYLEIKLLLENNKKLLFVGTPCQVNALKSFLGRDFDTLYTIDIVCHGAPSQKVWQKYLEEVSAGRRIINANFRSKSNGWRPTLLLEFDDGGVLEETTVKNIYYKAFINNLTLNKMCSDCSLASITRPGDITLGDFWGIKNFDASIDDSKGVSLIFLNSEKAVRLFSECNNRMAWFQKVPVKYAVEGNPIFSRPFSRHPNADRFFSNFEKESFKENVEDCLNNYNYEGIIANFWWSPNNYGAVLSAYAVQQYFLENNLDFHILNNNVHPHTKTSFSNRFVAKYLKLTHKVNAKNAHTLNKCTNNFVVGTDQVFRVLYTRSKNRFPFYTLSFTDMDKNRVAFSASFGQDHLDELSEDEKCWMSKCLARFNGISVREDSGVDVAKSLGVSAEHIVDPVFLVSKTKWDNLAKNSEKDCTGKILTYILDRNPEYEKVTSYLAEKYQCPVENFSYSQLPPEDFIAAIKTCEYFITDSFHGVCFALIFNKKVFCVVNSRRGGARFSSLIKIFNIEKIFVSNISKIIDENIEFYEYNHEAIKNIINKHRIQSRRFLERCFNSPPVINIAAEKKFLSEVIERNSKLQDALEAKYPFKIGKYLKYKILSKITFGSLRQRYKKKYKEQKTAYRAIKKS